MREYFIYFPRPKEPPVWGMAVTGIGCAHVAPGSDYPPPAAKHPADHMFQWGRGRVLEAWQLLLISEGEGRFESQATGSRNVKAGTVFILFPGVWHRYKPNGKTGWTESWIEFEGPVAQQLRRQGVLDPRHAVWQLGKQPVVTELMQRCHELAQARPAGYEGQLAGAVTLLLAEVLAAGQAVQAPTHMDEVVRQAQTMLMERCDQPLKMEALARELGVSPSHFRAAFAAHAGCARRQYRNRLRLRRAERPLLRNTPMTLKDIAEHLGYSSAFHLSKEFKKQTGMAPDAWRKKRVR